MGWSIGFDDNWDRDIGYGVPAICDKPGCNEEIHRGLAYICGDEPYGGKYGCGLFFCGEHLTFREPRGSDQLIQNCPRCLAYKPPYKYPSPDTEEWVRHKLTDESWQRWCDENPEEVKKLRDFVPNENQRQT